MQSVVLGWKLGKYKNLITVDPASGRVSHQQNNVCVIYSPSCTAPVQFVTANGLPPSFIRVRRAQQVSSMLMHMSHHPADSKSAAFLSSRRTSSAAALLTLYTAPSDADTRRVSRPERRRRLPNLSLPQRARALSAAARTARLHDVAALA
jgi:hypothetical protein